MKLHNEKSVTIEIGAFSVVDSNRARLDGMNSEE